MTGEVRLPNGPTPLVLPSPGTLTLYADAATKQVHQIDEDGFVTNLAGSVVLPVNERVVNSAADLPPPIAGQRFLAEGITYTLGADITINEEIVCANTGVFRGTHASGAKLSTTASRLFVGSNSTYWVKDIRLGCPNGTVFDFRDVAPLNSSILNTRDVVIDEAVRLARFESLAAVVWDNMDTTVDNGIQFFGSGWFVQSITNISIRLQTAGIGIDFGASVTSVISIDGPVVSGPVGSVAMNGAPNSANIVQGSVATVANSTFNLGGLITPLTNISPEDRRWQFSNNAGVPDSSIAADTYLTAIRTVTIGGGSQGVYIPINGTNWVSDVSERFTVSNTGILTYTNERASKVLVTATATVEKAGGGSDTIGMKVAVNGVVQDKTFSSTQNTSPTSITSVGIFTLQENDTVQMFVANESGTSNVIVDNAALTAINGF